MLLVACGSDELFRRITRVEDLAVGLLRFIDAAQLDDPRIRADPRVHAPGPGRSKDPQTGALLAQHECLPAQQRRRRDLPAARRPRLVGAEGDVGTARLRDRAPAHA
jgi:hypothetical protein